MPGGVSLGRSARAPTRDAAGTFANVTPEYDSRVSRADRRELMSASVVGTWRLQRWETRTADGRVSYPLGPDAVGYLCYTSDGYVFVAMMRADRPRYATNDLLGGTPAERAAAAGSYVTYCGRYHMREGRVIHQIDLSLFPNWTGLDQERFVELDGDRLTITTAPIAIGGTTTNRLVWERAGPTDA